jgi:hypothetical protein
MAAVNLQRHRKIALTLRVRPASNGSTRREFGVPISARARLVAGCKRGRPQTKPVSAKR